jgi:hypothetical protein
MQAQTLFEAAGLRQKIFNALDSQADDSSSSFHDFFLLALDKTADL